MISRAVNRTIEIESVKIPQAPGYELVYARWAGATTFSTQVMSAEVARKTENILMDPEKMGRFGLLMPHAATSNHNKAKDFTGFAVLATNTWVNAFVANGGPFMSDEKKPFFEPKAWGEVPGSDFQMVFFCSYDHSMMGLDGKLFTIRGVAMFSDDLFSRHAVDAFIKASNGKLEWVPSDYSWREPSTIYINFTDEEYTAMKVQHRSINGWWEVCSFMGVDSAQFEVAKSDDDDDDDDDDNGW